jgi:transposase
MDIHSNARTCPNSRATIIDHLTAGAWNEDLALAMGVSVRTGFKWLQRFREEGLDGLQDRSSRPHEIPNETPPERAALILLLRRCRLTAREIGTKLGMPRSTVSAVLKRHGMGRLTDLELRPVVRYEHDAPGDMLHLDVTKLARIRGVGHRITSDRSVRPRASAGSTCTSRSTITRGWRTSKCWLRARSHDRSISTPGAGLLPSAWHPSPPHPHRQRQELHLACLPGAVRQPRDRTVSNQALPALHEWQGRAFHPDADSRMGLQAAVRIVATPLQPPSPAQ